MTETKSKKWKSSHLSATFPFLCLVLACALTYWRFIKSAWDRAPEMLALFLQADIPLYAALLILCGAVLASPPKSLLRLLSGALLCSLITLQLGDAVLTRKFGLRLMPNQILWSLESSPIWLAGLPPKFYPLLIGLAAGGLLTFCVTTTATWLLPQHKITAKISLGVAGAMLLLATILPKPPPLQTSAKSIMAGFLKPGSAVSYKNGEPTPTIYEELPPLGNRPVILYIWESLGAHHTETLAASPESTMTPNFDALAKAGVYLTGLNANGMSTEAGLVSLLNGEEPLPPIGTSPIHGTSNMDKTNPNHPAIPSIPGNRIFLTTGDLAFSNKKPWLEKTGFNIIQGHDSPAYDGLPRGSFKAASDEALGNNAITLLPEILQPKGGLMVIETVGTHIPFIDVNTGKRLREREAYKLADDALQQFVENLKEKGFFQKEGVLVVTSDHAPMMQPRSATLAKYGDRSITAIPALILSKETMENPREEPGLSSQIELGVLCLRLAGGSAQRAPHHGVLTLSSNKLPKAVIHSRGNSLLYLSPEPGKDKEIEFEGDNTQAPEELKDYIRILRESRDQNAALVRPPVSMRNKTYQQGPQEH